MNGLYKFRIFISILCLIFVVSYPIVQSLIFLIISWGYFLILINYLPYDSKLKNMITILI